MAIIKIINSARKNYTIVDNSMLQDQNLSLTEKGLMAYLLQLPNDWDISQTQVERATNTGRRTMQKLFDSLMNKGYIVKRESRDERGRFHVEYDIYEKPTQVDFKVIHNENHRSTFTDTVTPPTVNATQLNTKTKSLEYKNNNLQVRAHESTVSSELKMPQRSRIELFNVLMFHFQNDLANIFEPRRQEIANEVVNAMVDMLYFSEHNGFYKANNKHYDAKELAYLLSKIIGDNLRSVIQSVFEYNNKDMPIRDRDRYIKAAILKQAESSRKIPTSDKKLLDDMFQTAFVPDYLEIGARQV